MVTLQVSPIASDVAKAATNEYLLGSSSAERDRLLAQGELFAPEARWLLDRIGVAPGWRAIDVGCGPLGILDLLSERVGPGTPVTGLDRELRMIAMARQSLAERPQVRARLVEGDATATRLRRASFDLAHARLLLVNVPDPEAVLAEMAALVRPGGIVAVQEVDWISWACEPPHPAWDRLLAANEAVWNRRGLDVRIGRRLPGLLHATGLVDVGFKVHARTFAPGDAYQTLLLTFTRLHAREIVARGLLGDGELAETMEALAAHLADPGTLTIFALFCQAWGRKPA
jgi:SAM-dependent methyltransferase